jgi:hypothetical protein
MIAARIGSLDEENGRAGASRVNDLNLGRPMGPLKSRSPRSKPTRLWILPESWKTRGTPPVEPIVSRRVSHNSLHGTARRAQAPQALRLDLSPRPRQRRTGQEPIR